MIVGALAVAVHGFPRATADLDLVVHLPWSDAPRVRKVLADAGVSNTEDRKDEFGQRIVAEIAPGLDMELFFTPPRAPYDQEFARRVTRELDGEPLPFISAEDLVLRKLVNTRIRRGQDYDDCVVVLAVQGSKFDIAYVRARAGIYRVGDLLERALKDAAGSEP